MISSPNYFFTPSAISSSGALIRAEIFQFSSSVIFIISIAWVSFWISFDYPRGAFVMFYKVAFFRVWVIRFKSLGFTFSFTYSSSFGLAAPFLVVFFRS